MPSGARSGSSTGSSIVSMNRVRSPCSRVRSRFCGGSSSRNRWSNVETTPPSFGCTLRHRDESTELLHARYLVGCDGARSSVRHGAGIPFEGGAYPQTFVLADLEVDGDLERDAAHAFLGARGMLFFFPL